MKNILFNSLLFISVLFLNVACNKSSEVELPIDGDGIVIKGILEDYGDRTRVGIIENNPDYGAAGEKFYWVNGDKIKLLLYPGGNLSATPIVGIFEAVVEAGVKSNNCSFNPVSPVTIPKGSYTVYSLYPAEGWVQNPDNSWTVSMPANNVFTQNDYTAEGVGIYMFKRAEAGTVVIGGGDNLITLPFTPMASVVRFSVKPNASKSTKFTQVALTASSAIFPTTATLSGISATNLIAGGFKTNSLTVNMATEFQSTSGEIDVFVPILPTDNLNSTIDFDIELIATNFIDPLEYDIPNVTAKIPSLANGFQAAYSYYFNLKHSIWARSNIVWDSENEQLTFAVSRADNSIIPANSQGLHFKWGSLVAVSAVDIIGSGQYENLKAPNGNLVYSPTGTYNYTWGNIPYITAADGGPFATYDFNEDDFATYNGNTGFDALTDKGDICRYISAMGWVKGNWRLPTGNELYELLMESGDGIYGESGIPYGTPSYGIYGTPLGDEGNHYGLYQPASGSIFGKGATSSVNIANPATGVVFPNAGYRMDVSGTIWYVGLDGYYSSGSSEDNIGYSCMFFSDYDGYRGTFETIEYGSATTVRCIRD